jgi:DNA-binding Lrp family transcriptional regulator
MAEAQLDALDIQLIDLLAQDARVSNRRIAAELDVTEGTVRGRIKRLQHDGLIAFTAITGLHLEHRVRLAFIHVQADIDRVRAIGQAIGDVPGINAVLLTLGEFNITAMCLIDDPDKLVELASDKVHAIDGVHLVETSIAVKTIKYNSRMAKITKPNIAEDGE